MAEPKQALDAATLKAFEHAAAGHDGVLSSPSGDLLIKPCTQAEVDFYQSTLTQHPDFGEMMPTFLGTLTLGEPAQLTNPTALHEPAEILRQQDASGTGQPGKKLKTDTAIVLENLEAAFRHANVLDLKLGARLYADGTEADKAARLDQVAAETTSGSLNFRIAGMKVWNGVEYDKYDKLYGRKFRADNVLDGFATFFAGLSTALEAHEAQLLLETVLAEVAKVRHMLQKYESRMYSASVLVVYEGDGEALRALMSGGGEAKVKTPMADERAPTEAEVKESVDQEEEEEEEDGGPPVAFKVRVIDFAHAEWRPGEGPDENVLKGLKSIEDQLDDLIARFD